LINDILDLSKIEAGKLDLSIGPVSIDGVCQASLRFITQMAHKKRIKLFSILDHGLTTLYADERRLKQILVNLLSNAIKFTPEGGEVRLRVAGDEARNVVQFIVEDTGIGIPPEEMARLFQPFVQLDSKLSRQQDGTGLGLSLVSRLAEMHGGSVSVESVVDQGSSFTVSLPGSQMAAIPQPATSAVIAARPELRPGAGRVLVIEDSPVAAALVAHYLAEWDLETTVHPMGEDALAKVKEFRPQVIILDIQLPNLSGWDVLAQLKAEPTSQHIPILVISVVDERPRGLDMGAAEYLVKPISRLQLQQALQQVWSTPLANPALTTRLERQEKAGPAEPPLILLAEDNEANINSVSSYLKAQGYRIMIARNGVEAIERAKEARPALILMDMQMPTMDGLEATRRLRTHAELTTVPIIALTALAMPGDRERCLAAGADDYLSKPVGLRQLNQLIQHQLHQLS
jgi:CheY-like chemotaxis protein